MISLHAKSHASVEFGGIFIIQILNNHYKNCIHTPIYCTLIYLFCTGESILYAYPSLKNWIFMSKYLSIYSSSALFTGFCWVMEGIVTRATFNVVLFNFRIRGTVKRVTIALQNVGNCYPYLLIIIYFCFLSFS